MTDPWKHHIPIFDRWIRFIVRHSALVLIAVLLVTSGFAFQLNRIEFNTSIYNLAIEDISENLLYEEFKKEFGSEEIILVVVKGDDFFDQKAFEKLERLSKEFSKIKGVRRAISLPIIKGQMDVTDKWDSRDFEKILSPVSLFKRNIISEDNRTSIITLILEDTEQKAPIINRVANLIKGDSNIYQIGMPLVSGALGDYTRKDFTRLPPLTFVIIGLVLFFFYRNPRGVFLPLSVVLVALVWTFGLMAWTNTAVSMLTLIVPIFLIAVGTAYCMHILSEYQSSIHESVSPAESVVRCFSRAGFPTALAVLTTIVGLGSLLVNHMAAIQEFALFACFGMISLLVVMLTFMPALLSLLPFPGKDGYRLIQDNRFINRLLEKIIILNLKYQKRVLIIISGFTLFCLVGIFFIRVETNPVEFFQRKTVISENFHDIYKDMAGSFPLSIVIDSKVDGYFKNPGNIAKISKIQDFLNTLEGVDKTISYADYLRLLNYSENRYDDKYYILPEEDFEVRILENNFKTILGKDLLYQFVNPERSKINIVLRTHLSSSRDFLATKNKIEEYLGKTLPRGISFYVTGFGIVISQSSRMLTDGQIKSLAITLILIFFMMFLLFMSGKVGLISLVPNCFPIIVNFGLMGWFGIPLSMATSLIASVAIGLAVDDTIHYLARFNREYKKDSDNYRALRDTVMSVGRPIIITTITISLGFSILIFSNFQPTAIFGVLMVVTIISALIADLIILPSLMLHVRLMTIWDLMKPMSTLDRISIDMAHELIQPLNAIKMGGEYLHMMVQKGETVPMKQLTSIAEEINSQVDRATEMIDRLKEFGRQEDMSLEKLDINSTVMEFVSLFGHQFKLQNIELKLDLDERIQPVLANSRGIRQIIFSLGTNAREAIACKNESGLSDLQDSISIKTFAEENHITLKISDTGAGIPEEARQWIFEPYFTTKKEDLNKGKGLGLFFVQRLVKNFKGSVNVRSEEGKGSTFTLSFPRAER